MALTDELIQRIISETEGAISEFDKSTLKAEKAILKKITELLKELEVKRGRVQRTPANVRKIGAMKAEITRLIRGPEYAKGVRTFLKAFDIIANLQSQYFASVINDFSIPKVLAAVRADSITATAAALTEAGLTANLVEPVQGIIRSAITSGGQYTALLERMRGFLTGIEDKPGALTRYTRVYTTDALNTFSAIYNQTVADDLDLVWFRYVGSLLETSREWCRFMVKKNWIHKDEFQTVINNHIDGVLICSDKIPCSASTELPRGMKAGTNPGNLVQLRGGWNCGHQLIATPTVLVPKDVVKAFLKK